MIFMCSLAIQWCYLAKLPFLMRSAIPSWLPLQRHSMRTYSSVHPLLSLRICNAPLFLSLRRTYSTDNPVIPVKIYKNTDLDKLQILKENKGKSGIYR